MKKTISKIMFSVLLCGMLGGCGKGAKAETTEVPEETTEVSTEAITTEVVTEEVTEEMTTEEKIDYSGKTTLTYIGHATVKIVAKDGTVIYIDPAYKSSGAAAYSDEADYVLVTHVHDDHIPCEFVKLKDGGQTITWKEALHDGIYETYDFGNVKIEAVKSGGNGNHRVEECVGYIVTVDGVSVYHAGDTSKNDWMSEIAEHHIDYAMYPIDGIYNMGATQATEAANMIGATHNIPIHEFDDVMSGKKKSDKFNPEGKLVIEYGETIIIGE